MKYPTPFSIPDDDAVRDLLARTGSLFAMLDALQGRDHRLCPIEDEMPRGLDLIGSVAEGKGDHRLGRLHTRSAGPQI